MKLLRWAVAGAASASVYVVYKYSIGKKSKGENIFSSPEDASADLEHSPGEPARPVKAADDVPAKSGR